MARDAARVVDRLAREQLRRIVQLLGIVERDAISRLAALDLADDTVSCAIREMQVRRILAGSQAAQELLELGSSTGPIAEAFRAGILEAYEDGLRSATAAAVEAGAVTRGLAGAFGAALD